MWRVLKIRFKPVETDPLVPIYGGGPWERWPRTRLPRRAPVPEGFGPAGMTQGSAERRGSGPGDLPSCCGVPPLTPRGRV